MCTFALNGSLGYRDPEVRFQLELLERESKGFSSGFDEEGFLYESITFPEGIQFLDQRLKTEFLYEYTDEESLRNPLNRLLEIPRVVAEIIGNLNDG